jgi:hypothetical protein
MPAGAELCCTMQPAQVLNAVVRIGCPDTIPANRAERHVASSASFVAEPVNSIVAHAGGSKKDE